MSALSKDQFALVERLYFEAGAMPSAQREAYLAAATTDQAVLREVRAMLAMEGGDVARTTRMQLGLERLAQDAEQMALQGWVGRVVGAYRIDELLARGGMGVVFRGHDVRLDRPVAIKAISDGLAVDAARLQRFEREARTIASLSHPHIALVYGMEELDGRLLLGMELLRGPTLAERLRPGPLPLDEALSVGAQVASAMQAAHDAGVIHRDLKPGNVMYAGDGVVKVLDFGLARSDRTMIFTDAGQPRSAITGSFEGVAVGTPGYMSPEQARGQSVDRRTDVFAFGCLVYECLTGKAAFCGDTGVDMITAVLNREPDWSLLPPRTPQAVRRLLERCTAKDPARRVRDMSDIRLELEDALRDVRAMADRSSATIDIPPMTPAPAPRRPLRLVGLSAAAVLLVALVSFGWLLPRTQAPAARAEGSLARFTIEYPNSGPQHNLSRLWLGLSRDGRRLVFCAAGEQGVVSMWHRELDKLDLRPVQATEDCEMALFSPDSQWVTYISNGSLWKLWLRGSNPIRLHDVHGAWGAHWTRDNRLVFVEIWGKSLAMMSADGGPRQRITTVHYDKGETAHLTPHMTPNGKAVLYTMWGGGGSQLPPRVDLVELATGQQRTLVEQGMTPKVAMTPRGLHLLWVRRNTLFAAPFDEDTLTLTGPETAIVDNVLCDEPNSMAYYDVSDEGTLAYVPGPLFSDVTRLAWADLTAGAGSAPIDGEPMPIADPRFTADGRKLSLVIRGNGYQGGVLDMDSGVLHRTTTEHDAGSGAISPDGRFYAYGSNRSGLYGVYLRDLQTLSEQKLGDRDFDFPGHLQWSPDSQHLVFCAAPEDADSRDIFLIDMDDPRTLIPFCISPFHETAPMFSPNGRWVAFVSLFSANQSSIREIYVASAPDGGLKRMVSRGGGHEPQWSPDGRVLYYRQGGAIMAMDFNPDTGQPTSQARPIWRGAFGQPDPDLTNYAVAPDGRILLIQTADTGYAADHVHLILNWQRLLQQR